MWVGGRLVKEEYLGKGAHDSGRARGAARKATRERRRNVPAAFSNTPMLLIEMPLPSPETTPL
jgi:hypothetical protein